MASEEILRLDAVGALKWLRARIRPRPGRTLVGIDGILGAGKYDFADELAGLLRESGLAVVRVSMKDFINLKALREAKGEDTGEGYYENHFNIDSFVEDVVEPLRNDGSGRYLTKFYDGDADCECPLRWSIAPNEAVVIVDGLFLHRPQFFKANGAKLWDYSVWLDVSFAVAFDRLCHSAGLDADPLADSNSRYYAGERLYIERCDPAAHADVVVDNTDPHDSVD